MCWGKSVVPISTVQGISVGQWIWSQIYDLIDMTMGRILGGEESNLELNNITVNNEQRGCIIDRLEIA